MQTSRLIRAVLMQAIGHSCEILYINISCVLVY